MTRRCAISCPVISKRLLTAPEVRICTSRRRFTAPRAIFAFISGRRDHLRTDPPIQCRQFLARHPQIVQREQRRQLGGVLLQPAIARLGVPELTLERVASSGSQGPGWLASCPASSQLTPSGATTVARDLCRPSQEGPNPAATWRDIPDYLLIKKSAFPACDWKKTHSLADKHFVTCRSFAF